MELISGRHPLIIVVGSGGVGKTTLAASLGVLSAREGRDTLVMTFDPSLRLKQTLGVGEEAQAARDAGGARRARAPPRQPARRPADLRPPDRALRAGRGVPPPGARRTASTSTSRAPWAASSNTWPSSASSRWQATAAMARWCSTPRPRGRPSTSWRLPSASWASSTAAPCGWRSSPGSTRKGASAPPPSGVPWAAGPSASWTRWSAWTCCATWPSSSRPSVPLYEGFRERALEVEELLRSRKTLFVLVTGPGEERIPDTLFFARKLEEAGYNLGPIVVNRVHPRFVVDGHPSHVARPLPADRLGAPLLGRRARPPRPRRARQAPLPRAAAGGHPSPAGRAHRSPRARSAGPLARIPPCGVGALRQPDVLRRAEGISVGLAVPTAHLPVGRMLADPASGTGETGTVGRSRIRRGMANEASCVFPLSSSRLPSLRPERTKCGRLLPSRGWVAPSLRPVLPSFIRASPLFVRFGRREGRTEKREWRTGPRKWRSAEKRGERAGAMGKTETKKGKTRNEPRVRGTRIILAASRHKPLDTDCRTAVIFLSARPPGSAATHRRRSP